MTTSEAFSKNFVLLLVNALPFGCEGKCCWPSEKFHVNLVSWSCRLTPSWTSSYDDYTFLGRLKCTPNAPWRVECLLDFLEWSLQEVWNVYRVASYGGKILGWRSDRFFGSQAWHVHESSSMGFTFGPRVEINLAEVVGTGLRHVNR